MITRDHPSHPSSATHPVPTRPETPAPSSTGSAKGWLTRRREARRLRRNVAATQRVAHRVELLGPQWRIVDYHPDDPDFLAVGPGGIFQVTVADHGRTRVQIAGEVVQIDGRRPAYVALARRDAARISSQMSRLAGRRIPVIPVVAFMGTGEIVYYGQPPKGCVVTSYRDIGKALNAHGNRIAPHTIEKLTVLARYVDSGTVGQFLPT